MIRIHPFRIFLTCATLGMTAWAGPSNRPEGPVNSYIVQVAQMRDAFQVGRGAVERMNGRLGHVYTRALRGFSIQLPPGVTREDILRQPGVIRVEADVRVYAAAQPMPTGVDRIDVDKNSQVTIDGVDDALNVDIAIIDSGIDVDHPDLRVVGGRRFYSRWWWSFEDGRFDDDNGHGTHCAGIAAAIDNGIGVVGVAPGARLWAVKVLDSTGAGYVSDLIAGVDWVTARADTIEVASLSLTATGKSDILREAIRNSVAAGVVYMAAVGNDRADIYGADRTFNTSDDVIPAAYPEVAAISAMADSDGKAGGGGTSTSYGPDDSFAGFSNFSGSVVNGNPVNSTGAAIDLMLPGVGISSCWTGGGYRTASGTSMACPHAAGLAALYIAEHGRASGASGVYAIRQALIDAGKDQASGMRLSLPATEPDGHPENLGWAGQSGPADAPPAVAIVSPTDDSTVSGTVTIQVEAEDAEDPAGGLTAEVSIDGGPARPAAYNSSSGYYELAWDTTTVGDGEHTIDASATDGGANTSEAERISVAVENVDGAPTATIVNPSNGSTLSGLLTIQVEATDAEDPAGSLAVVVSIEGLPAQTAEYNGALGYYELAWDTEAAIDGDYTLDASATDSIGNTTVASQITVTVDNTTTQDTLHVASIEVYTVTLWRSLERGRAEVVIVDATGSAVAGAAVTGAFTGNISEGPLTRVTDAAGLALFETTRWMWGHPNLTFCVEDVVHETLAYEPADNREDCDSND